MAQDAQVRSQEVPMTEKVGKLFFRLGLTGLISLAVVAFMGKPSQQSLQAMDSAIHARLALQVTSNGITPVLPMRYLETDKDSKTGFNDHPFTLFYINGWVMRAFGADAWSARLLPSAFAIGCVLLVVWIGTIFYSPTVGLAAGLVLTFNREFITFGARFQLDPAMIFFILLSFIAWWKRRPVWMGIGAGLGIWMKNPVALLVFPSAFLALLLTGTLNRKEFKTLLLASGVGLIVGSAVWVFSGFVGGWEMVADYWKRQVLGTAVGGRGYIQGREYFMWVDVLRRTYWPWLPLLLTSLYLIIRHRRWRRPEVALSLSATLIVIVIISSMRFKFPHYYLPMYPFVAFLTVDCVRNWIEQRQVGFAKFLTFSGMILPAFLLATPIELSPEMFPALRRFNSIIQSYGSCADKVLYIDGNQPYGSNGDYGVEIGFYANRRMVGTSCADANATAVKEKPNWVIVSGDHLEKCLTEDFRRSYPVRYQFGNQYLLSNLIDPKNALDLTVLARDLRAPHDCDPAPLPKSRYIRYE